MAFSLFSIQEFFTSPLYTTSLFVDVILVERDILLQAFSKHYTVKLDKNIKNITRDIFIYYIINYVQNYLNNGLNLIIFLK